MPAGNWIYDITSAVPGGGQVYVPPDAPAVTIVDATAEELYDGHVEIRVNWTPSATASADNFKGVSIYVEDPDMSETVTAPMDGTVTMDGTIQMAGKWHPTHISETGDSPADFKLLGQVKDRFIRVYLQAFNNVVNSTLIRANKTGATPSIRLLVPAAAGEYVSGQEHAWFITNPRVEVVPDFENVAGPKFSMIYGFDAPDPTIPLPPGLKPFGGVQIVFRYPEENDRQAVEKFLLANDPGTWVSNQYDARTITFFVLFCSADIDHKYNSPIFGLTPSVQVDITYDASGGATPTIEDFTISATTWVWQPDGTIFAQAVFTWTPPDSTRFSQVAFYVIDRPSVPPYELTDMRSGAKISGRTARIIDWPKTAQDWTVAAISIDNNGKLSDDPAHLRPSTPRATWHLGPATTGNAPLVTAPAAGLAAITYDQQLNSDGVVMMRQKIVGWTNPTGNQFGGVSIARIVSGDDPATGRVTWWDAKLNETSLTTDWEPAPTATDFDYYFVSRDPQGNRNQLLPGVTPGILGKHFAPQPGNVLASRLPKDWFNEAEFEWPEGAGGLFTVESIVAPKIFVGGILRVGGGTAANAPQFGGFQNGQIAVYNNATPTNELRAWMGEQVQGTPDNPGPHPIFGGWFKELYVGGDNPTNAPIYANSGGVVVVGGFDVAGTRYPYISVRDKFGVEKGRIGARLDIAQTPAVSPSDPAAIAGAWFQEFAAGGQSLSDWRILARRDTGAVTDLVNFRNINKFQIDYQANYNPGGIYPNPTNAAMTLLFGYDAFVADVANSAYRKFPGLSITRTGTGHQAVIINRGFVLNMPSGTPPYSPVKAGAFVTYNGDSQGGDAGTFWTVLQLYNQSSALTVDLGSGTAANQGSYLTMRDAGNNINFSVGHNGDVTIRGGLTLNSSIAATQYFISPSTQVITAGGQFNGPGGINTTGDCRVSGFIRADTYYYYGGSIIIDGGQEGIQNSSRGRFLGGVNSINGFVGCSQFGAYNASVTGNVSGWNYGITNSFRDQAGRLIQIVGGIIVSIS